MTIEALSEEQGGYGWKIILPLSMDGSLATEFTNLTGINWPCCNRNWLTKFPALICRHIQFMLIINSTCISHISPSYEDVIGDNINGYYVDATPFFLNTPAYCIQKGSALRHRETRVDPLPSDSYRYQPYFWEMRILSILANFWRLFLLKYNDAHQRTYLGNSKTQKDSNFATFCAEPRQMDWNS